MVVAGIVNDFLSHPSWQPLSRLTYTMYLVAIPVQIFMVYNIKELPIITHIDKVCLHSLQTMRAWLVEKINYLYCLKKGTEARTKQRK